MMQESRPMDTSRRCTLFVSHGSPMHALVPGPAGAAWQAIATELPRPRAILVASAHWETRRPTLSGSDRLATIHDFSGFPAPLDEVRYDVPGSPQLAQAAARLLRSAGFDVGIDGERGIDHGAWVPLKWMYPERDVPVVQLSLQTALGPPHHLRLGEALAPLASDGVLVVGSGHVTHNLHDWFQHHGDAQPLRYVEEFSEWLASRLALRVDADLLDYRARAPGAARAHPTEEHFLPLFVALGAAGPWARADRVHADIDGAALAMDAYRFSPGDPTANR